ncbi:integral membrane protein [Phyllosticta citrichinensis]
MDPESPPSSPEPQPSIFRWILGFLLVGAAWGLTTPFMRRAAVNYTPPLRPHLSDPNVPWVKRKVWGVVFAVIDLLRRPAYAVPFLLNVTGSIWFFLLIGKAELSLTVPITNSLAFLFTVLGEWWAEGKVISRDTWIGMALVLGGIGLCVHAKS